MGGRIHLEQEGKAHHKAIISVGKSSRAWPAVRQLFLGQEGSFNGIQAQGWGCRIEVGQVAAGSQSLVTEGFDQQGVIAGLCKYKISHNNNISSTVFLWFYSSVEGSTQQDAVLQREKPPCID